MAVYYWIVFSIFVSFAHASLPSNTSCGKQHFAPNPHTPQIPIGRSKRIVGGVEAQPWSWPWMAILKYNGVLHCAGSLVQNNNGTIVVITAAHCLQFLYDLPRWTVRLGVFSRANAQYETYFQEFGIRSVDTNPAFNSATFANDIAVVWLDGEVKVTEGVSPICVTQEMYSAGEYCVVTGWGTSDTGGTTMDRLFEVYKPILSTTECVGYLGQHDYDKVSMLCAGFEAGGADACLKDSGGPLACNRGGQWFLTGIVSWGIGCAAPSSPGVYTHVFQYVTDGWLSDIADI